MSWPPALFQSPQFRAGLRDMLARSPGTASWGLMMGVAMAQSGLSLFESTAMPGEPATPERGAAMTDGWTLWVIVGMACVTVVTRCFFFISGRPWPLPGWAERGLPYAPIAALAAVVVPEIIMVQGELIGSWKDARLFGAAAGLTIVVGMAVYLPLRLALGW